MSVEAKATLPTITRKIVSLARSYKRQGGYIWVAPSGFVSWQDGTPMDNQFLCFHCSSCHGYPDWTDDEDVVELDASIEAELAEHFA